MVASDNPHYEGPLSYVLPCRDPACVARRERAWAVECGEVEPDESQQKAAA